MIGVLAYFKEIRDDSAANVGIRLLASSVIEAIDARLFGGMEPPLTSALVRGSEFLKAAAAFCDHQQFFTSDGISSTEAFLALMSSERFHLDLESIRAKLLHDAEVLERSANGHVEDLSAQRLLFANLRRNLIGERSQIINGLEQLV